MELNNKKILITGGAGFLGSHVVKNLRKRGVLQKNIFIPRSKEFDLRISKNCKKVLKGQDIVIHLAANVGGIGYNLEHPGEMFYDNVLMGTYLLDEARKAGVEKFVSIGTVCSYPKLTPIPFKEKYLWDGYPEETNAPYGLAKKMLLVQGQAYRQQYGFHAIYLIPINLYGPRDKFDPKVSHVVPALIRKIIDARDRRDPWVEVWGTGKATREFLYVEDAAEAIVLATMNYDDVEPVNLGTGIETSIKKVVELIMNITNYKGRIKWNTKKPDGQPRRRLDVSRAKKYFGFEAKTALREGLKKTIEWYEKEYL